MKAIPRSTGVADTRRVHRRCVAITVLALSFLCMPPIITPGVAGSAGCIGDCDDSRRTTVDELVRLVNLALTGAAVAACPQGDADGNNRITVEELVSAVRTSLEGCSALPPSVDADSLCFIGALASPIPEQTINVTKAAGVWNAAANVSWVSISPGTGSAPSPVQIGIDPVSYTHLTLPTILRV